MADQLMFDLFVPPVEVCEICGNEIAPYTGFWHMPRPLPGFGLVCSPMASSLVTVTVWLNSLAVGYTCKGGVIVRNESADLDTAAHFVGKARSAWGARVGELDAWLLAYMRWTGTLDLFTGDALPRTDRRVWTPEQGAAG